MTKKRETLGQTGRKALTPPQPGIRARDVAEKVVVVSHTGLAGGAKTLVLSKQEYERLARDIRDGRRPGSLYSTPRALKEFGNYHTLRGLGETPKPERNSSPQLYPRDARRIERLEQRVRQRDRRIAELEHKLDAVNHKLDALIEVAPIESAIAQPVTPFSISATASLATAFGGVSPGRPREPTVATTVATSVSDSTTVSGSLDDDLTWALEKVAKSKASDAASRVADRVARDKATAVAKRADEAVGQIEKQLTEGLAKQRRAK